MRPKIVSLHLCNTTLKVYDLLEDLDIKLPQSQ